MTNPGRNAHVQLLGTDRPVRWKQTADGLQLEMPKHYEPPTDYAVSFKVLLA